jgi:pimeloyl-ACP methyl ester carboxylesterase
VRADILKVPGATLYYEVRGAGPVLLLICGGIYDAAGYAGLAARFVDRYTVVTYDRRGNSRSPLDEPPEPQRIAVHTDDAHRVLAEVTDDPAYVFGNSSGASIGLDLAARHPEQVRVLVAHEPPFFELLPDRDRFRALMHSVEYAFAHEGAGAAMEIFREGIGMRRGEPETPPSDPEIMEMLSRFEKNSQFFIGYEVPPFGRYAPDVIALRLSSVRIVPAAGEQSRDEPPHRATLALAEYLGTPPVFFPGGHGGFGTDTDAFAARLAEAL